MAPALPALKIGLIGDRDESITAHRAIPVALDLASRTSGATIGHAWLATDTIATADDVAAFDGLWCVPGSPYRSINGALYAIGHARRCGVPFLGTCGGFQHGVIEYARSVLGWLDADHAETAQGENRRLVISMLDCALVEASEALTPMLGTRLAQAYGNAVFEESYRCRFGLNPTFVQALAADGLAIAATSADGEARALELRNGHPFYVLALFQPERAALQGRVPPLVGAFAAAALQHRIGVR